MLGMFICEGQGCHLRAEGVVLKNMRWKQGVVRDLPHLGKKQGEWYVNKKCNHAKNEAVYYLKNRFTIVKQVQWRVKGE
jgi:hypothetical protein